MLGVIEVAIGILIAARPFSARASALGSALAVGMFLTTLSLFLTTPGVWEPAAGGFPALSALPGAVPHQGFCPAGDFALVAWRSLAGEPAKVKPIGHPPARRDRGQVARGARPEDLLTM
jgi:hypothetical protein